MRALSSRSGLSSSTIRYTWKFTLARTPHTVEFVDGAFGLKVVTVDGEENVNVRSTMVSSFIHRFDVGGAEFVIKKDEGDYDLFYERQPHTGLRGLAESVPKVIGGAGPNPFENAPPKQPDNFWPSMEQPTKPSQAVRSSAFPEQPAGSQKSPFGTNPFSSPPTSNVDLLELEVKKPTVKSNKFANPFEEPSNKVPPRNTVAHVQPAAAEIDFMSLPAKPAPSKSQLDLQMLGFEDLTPKSQPTPPPKSATFPPEFSDDFPKESAPTDAFADFPTQPFKPTWTGFRDLQAQSNDASNPFEVKRKLQIFDKAPTTAPVPKPTNPFAAYEVQQQRAGVTNPFAAQSQPIFDSVGDSFKDAVLVPKGDRAFETKLGKASQIPLEDYVANGGMDEFDIELERNKRENEQHRAGRYDIDPEEKIGEIIEGVQGLVHKTSKFLGRVE